MERLELEGKKTYKNPQNVDNRGNFTRPNKNSPQIMKRECWHRGRPRVQRYNSAPTKP
jgi:hypothetical protein